MCGFKKIILRGVGSWGSLRGFFLINLSFDFYFYIFWSFFKDVFFYICVFNSFLRYILMYWYECIFDMNMYWYSFKIIVWY